MSTENCQLTLDHLPSTTFECFYEVKKKQQWFITSDLSWVGYEELHPSASFIITIYPTIFSILSLTVYTCWNSILLLLWSHFDLCLYPMVLTIMNERWECCLYFFDDVKRSVFKREHAMSKNAQNKTIFVFWRSTCV